MTPVLLGNFKPLSDEWHAARAHGLGGSEIAATLGLSKWESRFSLYHRKAGNIGPQPENQEMEAGKRLEDAICQKWADEHPEMQIDRCGTYTHSDRPWQIANPDRLILGFLPSSTNVGHVAILEAKFVLYPDDLGPTGTDEIPVAWRCQVLWYLDVMGLATAYIEVFIGSCGEFREYVIHADPTEQKILRDAGAEFMTSLAAGDIPSIDAHSATYEAVRELHPDITPDAVELPADVARDYCTSRHDLAAAKDRAQHTTSVVADLMGNAQRATFNTQVIARRQARGEGTPYLVAAKNLPDFSIKDVPA